MAASSLFSELIFDCVGTSGRKKQTAEFRVPVTPLDPATLGLAAYVGSATEAAAYFGNDDTDHLSAAGLIRVRLEVDLGIAAVPIPSSGADVRNIWEMVSSDIDPFRRSIPGRALFDSWYTAGTAKQQANLSFSGWVNFLSAFDGLVDTVALVNPETGDPSTFSFGRATVRPRAGVRI
jgi:hypothetical protein